MAALTADAIRLERNVAGKHTDEFVVATSAVIYVGSLVTARTGLPNLVRAAVASSTDRFVGVAETGGTGVTAGTVRVRVAWGHEIRIDSSTAVSASLIGSDVTVGDDNMVTSVAATTNDVRVGELVRFDVQPPVAGANVWVRVRQHSRTDS